MKIITETQIKEVLQVLFQLNIPVQAHASIQQMFERLPIAPNQNVEDKSTKNK